MAAAGDQLRHADVLRRPAATFAAIPGVPPVLACLALLLAWDLTARLVGIDSLPSPWSALKEVPVILGDGEALLDILASVRRMAIGLRSRARLSRFPSASPWAAAAWLRPSSIRS